MIRRCDLPDSIDDFPRELLRVLCEEKAWNARDISDEVHECYKTVHRRLAVLDVTPSDKKSPRENLAADLWRSDPEDYGLSIDASNVERVEDYRESDERKGTLGEYSDNVEEGGAA